ncbi:ABC transporter permease [Clostridia bacterium]|nr:ABC transporter permease [Clostridia bacterium]
MRAYAAFTKKEFTESLRTSKVLILAAVFLVLGAMSPLFAKLLPDLLNGMESNGVVISMPESTAMDSWVQFFSNLAQLGMIVLAIIFGGLMSNEFSRGTLVNVLTKGMKRHIVILSKITVSAVLWTVSYLLCLGVSYAYTAYFWEMPELHNAFLAFFAPWVFGMFLTQLLIFGGTLFKNFIGSLLSAGIVVTVLGLLSLVPKFVKYLPTTLCGDNTKLLTGIAATDDYIPALILTAAVTVLLAIGSILIFNRKQV